MFVWRIYHSEHCKESNPDNIMYGYTMSQALKLLRMIEMQDAIEEAKYLDSQAENKA